MQMLVHSHEFNLVMERFERMENRLGRMESDITTLKVQGNRNEVAIRELQDDMREVKQDVKWLKRSQGSS